MRASSANKGATPLSPRLASPAAIHIATAERLRHSLDVVLTYDATMAKVLRAHGLTPATAGDTPPPPRANP